jgi:hypothetical protein
MAEEVKFGQKLTRKPRKNQKGLILFPPTTDGGQLTLRFLGTQQKMYQLWNTATKKFTCSDRYQEGYITRVVSFVIDRADEKVKAFVCPISVFDQLGQYSIEHDFLIHRHGLKLNTRYEIKSLGETKVSQDLLDKIEVTSQVYSLTDIFVKNVRWELLDKESEPINDRFEILDL